MRTSNMYAILLSKDLSQTLIEMIISTTAKMIEKLFG